MIKRLFTVKEASTYLNLSIEYFMKLVKAMALPQPIKHPDVKKRLWDKQDLDRYIEKRKGCSDFQSQSINLFREKLANAAKT